MRKIGSTIYSMTTMGYLVVKVMTASHVALNSPNIIKNKPELESKIIETFLNIDTIHKGKQKELVKAYIIEALIKIYPDAHDKDKSRSL